MILVSTGFWVDQAPGAESVAGVCLLLTPGSAEWRIKELPLPAWVPPGYGVDLLALFEHPVDTRPSSYSRALMLALTDLPAARPVEAQASFQSWAQRRALLNGDWWRPEPQNFSPPCDVWSRVRRYRPNLVLGPDGRFSRKATPVRETVLIFRRGCHAPVVAQGGQDEAFAHGQAASLGFL